MKKIIYILISLAVLLGIYISIMSVIYFYQVSRLEKWVDFTACRLNYSEELCSPLLDLSKKQRQELINEGLL